MAKAISYNLENIEKTMYCMGVVVLSQVLDEAIKVNDLEVIDELMNATYLPSLSKTEKENIIFNNLHTTFTSYNEAEDLLKHLIFDYKISERTSMESPMGDIPVDEKIKKMFETRRLHEKLSADLLSNNDKSNKKPKV